MAERSGPARLSHRLKASRPTPLFRSVHPTPISVSRRDEETTSSRDRGTPNVTLIDSMGMRRVEVRQPRRATSHSPAWRRHAITSVSCSAKATKAKVRASAPATSRPSRSEPIAGCGRRPPSRRRSSSRSVRHQDTWPTV